ncbi:pyruvate kinase [Solimonas variicoloris]|uniref:pyruvate kinase n=1 Tax=Solimonas variicoloris TaxID=254408 RepID=UPI000375FE76|nr:pyruvate kinase [Solimonas variicoloris]
MARRTKIVATLGPATDAPDVLRKVLAAGVDVVRLNFSHGSADDHRRRAAQVRAAAQELGRDVGILADLQGPKIRIESFAAGPVELHEGQRFTLDTALGAQAGDASVVGCAYQELPRDVAAGDVLLLNDGAITMRVDEVAGMRVICTVLVGGPLSNRKGINKLGGGLSAAALTEKDKDDLRTAVALDADFIAVSFPRSAADMAEARALMQACGGSAWLVAKIERAEALPVLRELVAASDAVMVARGDLGVEIGDAELPGWQKRIIAEALEQNRMVITATQMMESMITSPIPTRAEVLDVANAVMDGTDAVMLSAETATGRYPVKVVEAMARVCIGAEATLPVTIRRSLRFDTHFERTDEAIAMATSWTARHMHARAVIAMTESGATALMMSRSEGQIPIYALTPHERTRRRMALCRGVYPYAFQPSDEAAPGLAKTFEAIDLLKARGMVADGDRVLITKGDGVGPGGTNTMKIMTVGQT